MDVILKAHGMPRKKWKDELSQDLEAAGDSTPKEGLKISKLGFRQ
jgi:hypothetical protein